MANRVQRGHSIADRYRREHTAPQADEVADAGGQVSEMKGQFNLSRRQNQQQPEQEQHGCIHGQQDLEGRISHGLAPLLVPFMNRISSKGSSSPSKRQRATDKQNADQHRPDPHQNEQDHRHHLEKLSQRMVLSLGRL